ncbi:hypothetical protein, conserved [Babesia bigemina]|uniref:Uncharacterized protein n=1 Tax=Babesia bigemina TaxID=5866 RepID=A0A061DBY7_BABBI|nr:hypothetical protein, conserved [Babesia bigemina]CDR98098.1 hypothetical protein, conserved [Babesia bigemina]|eukprot:XP_012770284.1 hypothetical protein, conserved [Babesia bigemina]
MIIAVFAWNIQTQKDHQLVNSLHLLVNELTPTHLVISRSTAENLLKNLHHWLSATGAAISAIRQEMIHADIARQNTLMLIQMVTAVLSIIKAALSPETLDKNMTLLHCIVNTCTMPPIEDLLFDIKDSKFDATSKLLGLEEMRPKTIELLEFLSLILRTFMGYKLNSMYELNNTKVRHADLNITLLQAGYGNHSVTLVVSNVIREIYESDNQTKSALALAIIMDIEAPSPPPSPLTDVMQYHMSQIWIAAYRNQSRHTLWRYDLGKT